MIIRTTSDLAHPVYIIKRPFITDTAGTDNLIKITDDLTQEDLNYTVGFGEEGDYHRLQLAIFGLVEGRFYSFKVFDRPPPASGLNPPLGALNCVYKDKIFCTNQSIDQIENQTYSINEGVYTENQTENNDYIVL